MLGRQERGCYKKGPSFDDYTNRTVKGRQKDGGKMNETLGKSSVNIRCFGIPPVYIWHTFRGRM